MSYAIAHCGQSARGLERWVRGKEGLGLILSTYQVTATVTPVPGGPCSPLASEGTRHAHGTHIHKERFCKSHEETMENA